MADTSDTRPDSNAPHSVSMVKRMSETETENVRTEEHVVAGDRLVERLKQLVHEGNIRRIVIKNDEGKTVFEIPLTLGVVGVALIPIWVAVGAIAALAAQYTIVVEKKAV